ncbi:MAG: serine protease [Candidatus Omnitrophota bacterium]
MTNSDHTKWRLDIFLFTAIFFLSSSGFNTCAASIPKILDRSEALVSIQSVNALGSTEDKTGLFGGAAILFSNKNPTRLIKYSRDGSGVIIDPQGIIVTNAHLVQKAAGISVKLFNGTHLAGRVIYEIPGSDIAFLSIKPSFPLSYVPLANSDRLVPGTRVYCIGHALNHRGSIFGGKVSVIMKQSVSRGFGTAFLQVQFGFHLYGGDSGSPILNQKGELVGLVSGGRRGGDMATLAIASNVIRDAYWNIPKY